MKVASAFKSPHLANETKVVRSYIKVAKYIYLVAEKISTDNLDTIKSQEELHVYLKELENAGKENEASITEWRTALGPKPWHYRVQDAIDAVRKTVNDTKQIIEGRYFY